MRIGGLTSADKAGLPGNEFQMRLVTQPFGLGDTEKTVVDLRAPKRAPQAQGAGSPMTRGLLDVSLPEVFSQSFLPPASIGTAVEWSSYLRMKSEEPPQQ
jgi:hypothetical protein